MKLIFLILLLSLSAPQLALAKLNPEGLKELEAYLFEPNEVSSEQGHRKGKRTDSALILMDGQTVYERYARGYDANKKHIMWSTSKTAMALLIGVAEKNGLVRRDQSICDFLKDLRPETCAIRVRDVLQWSTGLKWREEYENAPSPRMSSVLAMLYGEGREDMARFVLSHSFDEGAKPGQTWRYSSGDSILLAAILREIYHGQNLREVFRTQLYGPLGMTHWLWESDIAGTLSGGYFFFVSTPDLARLGQIFLNNGVVDKKQIVSRDFLDFMRSVPESFLRDRRDHGTSRHMPGAHLWLNRGDVKGFEKPWPTAPDDLVVTMGHWGQYLLVSPSLKLIAVRTGDNRDHTFSVNEFVARVMSAVNGSPLPQFEHKGANPPAAESRLYRDGIVTMGLRFTARAFCQCLFVAENSEAACRDYASLDQVSPRLVVDYPTQTVRASLFWIIKAQARYLGAEKGCGLN